MKSRSVALTWCVLSSAGAAWAGAKVDAGIGDAGTQKDAAAAKDAALVLDARETSATCTELVPADSVRPTLSETFSMGGVAGYEWRLSVDVSHGLGETVMPDGLRLQDDARFVKALKDEGFALASRDGLSPSVVAAPMAQGDHKMTRVEFALVPLPEKAGRQSLRLPALPIVVGRASGAQTIVCTQTHSMVVEDPIANLPDALPRTNPPPRQQREPWLFARIVAWTLVAAAGSFVAGFLARAWWRRRPKPAPPAPPPRPAWEIAREKLRLIEAERLLEAGKFVNHHDRVTDVIREFLGSRFGFDGLECTSAEMLAVLKRRVEAVPHLSALRTFLDEADLIKFAKMTPTKEVCERVLLDAHRFVKTFSPEPAPSAPVEVRK